MTQQGKKRIQHRDIQGQTLESNNSWERMGGEARTPRKLRVWQELGHPCNCACNKISQRWYQSTTHKTERKKKTERSKPETVSLPWRGWGQKPKMKTAVIKNSSSQTQVHIRIIWKACFSKTNSWVSPLLILSLKWCLCKDPMYSNAGCPSSRVYKHWPRGLKNCLE